MTSASSPPTPEPPQLETGLHRGPVEVVALAGDRSAGGECVFLGRTRGERHKAYGELLRLEYEAYPAMAERGLAALAAEVAAEFGCTAVRLVHAVGPVAVGEASVVVQTAAAHRAEAFAACRAGIDRLKAELPIWKREVWAGGETFVAGTAVGGPRG